MEGFKVPPLIEYNNRRVLLSSQLAECYESKTSNLRGNFHDQNSRFVEGEHFFRLKGGELKNFKLNPVVRRLINLRAPVLYLWTEQGAALHAKILSGNRAKEVFELLKLYYFNPDITTPPTATAPPTENGLQLFEHEQFGKIRVVVVDERNYFVAADVCRALDIKNVSDALTRLEDDEKRMKMITTGGVVSNYTQGGEQNMLVVNEPGFYRLVFSSRKKEALEFQHWVYHEVLPLIRKTGSYSLADTKPAPEPPRRRESKRKINLNLTAAQKDRACVYAFLMSDNTVKIGMSGNVDDRRKKLENKYNLTVLDIYHSPFMSRQIAAAFEHACHKIFSTSKVSGEFFDVKFEEACNVIDAFVEFFASVPQFSNYERGDKLLSIATMMEESPERQLVLFTSAKLIVGEEFY